MNINDNVTSSTIQLLNESPKSRFMTLYLANKKLLLDKIKNIQNLFKYENQQVDTIIALLWISKKSNPLGLSFLEVINELKNRNHFYLYKSNSYLRSMLNIMAQPEIGLLELSEGKNKINLTSFGFNYYIEGDNSNV